MWSQLTRGSRQTDDEIRALAKGPLAYKGLIDLCRETNDNQDRLAESLGIQVLHLRILDNGHPAIAQVKQCLDFMASPGN